ILAIPLLSIYHSILHLLAGAAIFTLNCISTPFFYEDICRFKNTLLRKPRQIKALRACVPSTRVFACIGEGEYKNRDFGGKMAKL
ncbi:MAG: hypothetical protein MRQ09_04790, partial [Candidatus Midichloria sp.]|nr:hypothetical protein [Candidatus Midichloria sp.]